MLDWLALTCAVVGSVAFLTVAFAVAVWRDRYDSVDIAWGLAFIVIALISFGAQSPRPEITPQVIVTLLVIIWGTRLAWHIYGRWRASDHEDKRYVSLRRLYENLPGGVRVNMYGRVFMIQAVLAVIVALPVIVVNTQPWSHLSAFTWAGVAVWAIGFYFESVGDYQLKTFVAKPANKGTLMTSGLWKYTRHPNYFGEMTQWWGMCIIALGVVPSLWWLSIVGPAVITVLLVFISGVPMTEKHFEGRPGWAAYKRRTSKLIPLPPRH